MVTHLSQKHNQTYICLQHDAEQNLLTAFSNIQCTGQILFYSFKIETTSYTDSIFLQEEHGQDVNIKSWKVHIEQ